MKRLAGFSIVALLFVAVGAPARAEQGLRRLESLLATDRSGWQTRIPGAERALKFKAPLPPVDLLEFDIRLLPHDGEDALHRPVRCLLQFKNRQGWAYQSRVTPTVPVRGWRRLRFDLSPGSADWDAVGHYRPWDAEAGRNITSVNLRLYGDDTFAGRVFIRRVRATARDQTAAQTRRAIIDFETLTPAVAGRRCEFAFRTRPDPADVFDPAQAPHLRLCTPSGEAVVVAAFRYQDYVPIREGSRERLVPRGPAHWRVRFVPPEPGRHKLLLYARGPGREAVRPVMVDWLEVRRPQHGQVLAAPSRSGAVLSREVVRDGGEAFVLPLTSGAALADPITLRVEAEDADTLVPLPPLTDRVAVYEDAWHFTPQSAPQRAWTIPLEWNPQWGSWRGLGAYNLEIAWRFDRVLRRAEARGLRLPLALLDDRAFFNQGKYRWPMNPLAARCGGPLRGPAAFFRQAVEGGTADEPTAQMSRAARRFFLKRCHYLLARYGYSPAIDDWLLASGLPANDVAAWHQSVGIALKPWLPPGDRLVSLHPLAVPFERVAQINRFEPDERWQRARAWKIDRRVTPDASARVTTGLSSDPEGERALEVRGDFPGEACLVRHFPGKDNMFAFERLMFDVYLPATHEHRPVPHDMRVLIYLRDGEWYWYQQLLDPMLRPGDWTSLVVDLTGADNPWQPVGHQRPFEGYTRQRVREMGVRVFCAHDYDGPLYVDNVQVYGEQAGREDDAAPDIEILAAPAKVGCFEKMEVTFDVNRVFSNPFDPAEADIWAVLVEQQTGKRQAVPCFFFQDYERYQVDGGEHLRPVGPSVWKARLSAARPGRYRWHIEWRDPGRPAQLLAQTTPAPLDVTPSERKGFIQVAEDGRHFQHSTGEFFYPIGMNLRSPSDNRDVDRDPTIRDEILQAANRGTYQYDDYFEQMQAHDMNWARIWMCSWWLALEWYREWPGYHGRGRYSMQNAWRMDYLVDQAEQRDIYIQLCTMNHGQMSTNIDHEWEFNPLNLHEPDDTVLDVHPQDKRTKPRPAPGRARPGGILNEARHFYDLSREDARLAAASHQNKLRYIIARWGYSPHIMAWVLSSEAEFTEEYWLNAYDRGERSPKTSRWHRVMVEFVKQLDHGRHLVTTHFSHPHRGQITWSQNHGLDYVQSNAYTTFWFPGFGGNGHIGSGQGAPHALRVYFERYMKKFNRPVIVGEWGGHWMRNETPVLEGELRTGCWGAACTGLSGNTGFWWWPYIHFGKNYQPYAAVARFMRGEDRRGLDLSDANVSVLADQGRLRAVGVANNRRADVYVYGRTAPMSLHNVVPVSGADLLLQGLADGTYKVEFWDCAEGRPTGTRQVTSTNGRLRVDLPRVSIDVALKIRPARGR